MVRKNLFQCWLSDNEYLALRTIADQDQDSLSEAVRKLIKAKGKRVGTWPIPAADDKSKAAQVTQ